MRNTYRNTEVTLCTHEDEEVMDAHHTVVVLTVEAIALTVAVLMAAAVMATLAIVALCIQVADAFTWPVRGTKR